MRVNAENIVTWCIVLLIVGLCAMFQIYKIGDDEIGDALTTLLVVFIAAYYSNHSAVWILFCMTCFNLAFVSLHENIPLQCISDIAAVPLTYYLKSKNTTIKQCLRVSKKTLP